MKLSPHIKSQSESEHDPIIRRIDSRVITNQIIYIFPSIHISY